MPQYQSQGKLPQKRYTKLYRPGEEATKGSFYFEYIVTAEGFAAEASIQYRLRAPARVLRTEVLPAPDVKLREDMADSYNLMFEVDRVQSDGDFVQSRREMLCSDNTAFSVAKPNQPMSGFYRNSMADEVVLIVQGSGTLESSFGNIPYGELDVVYVPRGDTVRWKSDAKPHLMIIFESSNPITVPQEFLKPNGQFREHAPYHERDIRMPVLQPAIDEMGEFPVEVKLGGKRIRTVLDHHPFDVVGWDGYYYPWALNLKDYEPLSGRISLLPDRYALFTTSRTLITLISPRRMPDHPDAMPMQPHHQNLEYDEILYRFSGSTGATEPQPGSFTLHPRGIDHGPKPGFEKLPTRTYQDAWGFMIDTRDRLIPTAAGMAASDESYGRMYVTDQSAAAAKRGA